MQDSTPENMDFLDEQLKNSFRSWKPEFEENKLWDKLSESLDFEEEVRENKKDFEETELTVPPQIWDKLNASLDGELTEKKLKENYKIWNQTPNESVFERITESLQVERVWDNLNHNLNYQNRFRSVIWIKLVAVFILMLLTFYTRDNVDLKHYQIDNSSFTFNEINITENKLKKAQKPDLAYQLQKEIKKQTISDKKQLPKENKHQLKTELNPVIYTKISKLETIDSNPEKGIVQVDRLKFLTPELINDLNLDIKHLRLGEELHDNKFHFGLNYFSTFNFIQNNVQPNLTTNMGGIGHEFGLFFTHSRKNFRHEYFINYIFLNQTESTFTNGVFSRNYLSVSGVKIVSFTKFKLNSKTLIGGGITLFSPNRGLKTQNNKIVDIPKTNFLNVGFNLGVDFTEIPFLDQYNVVLGFKYESIFSLKRENSSFKNFQHISLGLKYTF